MNEKIYKTSTNIRYRVFGLFFFVIPFILHILEIKFLPQLTKETEDIINALIIIVCGIISLLFITSQSYKQRIRISDKRMTFARINYLNGKVIRRFRIQKNTILRMKRIDEEMADTIYLTTSNRTEKEKLLVFERSSLNLNHKEENDWLQWLAPDGYEYIKRL